MTEDPTAPRPEPEGPRALSLPPYSYVPGGPWPHPTGSAEGHAAGRAQARAPVAPIEGDAWERSEAYAEGLALFNAGYYWEAHEAWEALWHAQGRSGPIADLLRALIKLAAAGVKVREGQRHGIVTHARRAAALIDAVRARVGGRLMGLDLAALAALASQVADNPPQDPAPPGTAVSRVFSFQIEPS